MLAFLGRLFGTPFIASGALKGIGGTDKPLLVGVWEGVGHEGVH